MKYFKILIFFQLILFLYSCSTIKEGFINQKKSSSDEFLVEKKSPLVMPPDYNDLPVPDQNKEKAETNENKIKENISVLKEGQYKMCGSKFKHITQNWKFSDQEEHDYEFIGGTMFMVDFKFFKEI